MSKLTGSLENKLTAVEKLSHKLARLHKQRYKDAGSIASGLTEFGISDKSDTVSRLSIGSSTPSCVSRNSTIKRCVSVCLVCLRIAYSNFTALPFLQSGKMF